MTTRSLIVKGGAVLATVVVALAIAGGTLAADHKRKSHYTSLDPAECKILKAHPDGNSFRCPGLIGTAVYFAEGHLRAFLSFGARAEIQRSATQTLSLSNTPFEGRRRRATIEWRVTERFGKVLPYATIVRYFIASDGKRGQVLVVTRLTEKEACHVAHIDALANSDAIMMARRVADEVAPKFDCRSEPRVEGTPGILRR